MVDMPRTMLTVSLLLMIANILGAIWYFYFKRDVMLTNDGIRNLVTILVLGIMVALAVAFGIVLYQGISNSRLSGFALSGTVSLTVLLIWSGLEIEGIKARAMETVETIVSILEVENSNLDGHSLHVHNLTMLLYDYLPFSMKRKINRVDLAYASLFIDLGKLGVPAQILNKTGKLLSDEWAMMKRHPEISAKIFEPIPAFHTINDWILYHHERMDGNGYYRKKGKEIPLAARVITVADTYSSITMVRAFKPSLPYADAIMELKLAAGSQLDPEIVEVFCEIPKDRVDACFEDVRRRMERFEAEGFREEPRTLLGS